MGLCPRSPKLTKLNLGPRSLAGLMFHSQFLLVRFGLPIVDEGIFLKQHVIMPARAYFPFLRPARLIIFRLYGLKWRKIHSLSSRYIIAFNKMNSGIDSRSQLQRSCRELFSIRRWCLQLAGGISSFWLFRGSISPTKLTSAWAVLLFAPPTWVTE